MAAPAGVRAAGALVILLLSVQTPTHACSKREPTQETSPGPHDFSFGSTDSRLWREGDGGEPLFLRARVLDMCGEPVTGAQIRILHANQHGDHEPDRWRAHLSSDDRGTFEIVTVYPGYTGAIPRHIHFVITHPAHRRLVTRLFFKNDPTVGDGIEPLAVVPEVIRRGERKGWAAGYEFVLSPR